MERAGPPLESLLRRLAETPADFLDEPHIGDVGGVFVPALVNDLLADFGVPGSLADLERFRGREAKADRNRLMLVQIVVWLLSREFLTEIRPARADVLALLDTTVGELAAVAADQYIQDPDRREELARIALARLGLRPQGESQAQASDRLSAISGAERHRLLLASRAAEARARAVREALVRKQAEASADKWTRE